MFKLWILLNFLNSLIEGASDTIFVADIVTGSIVYANKAACVLFECELSYLIGKHQSQLHPPEDLEDIARKFREFTTSDRYKETTAHILTKNGSKKLVLITSANMFEMDGKMYASAYFKDISHVEQLKKIAHDQSHLVRRPLANILGISKILTETGIASEEEKKELVTDLYFEAQQLDSVVKTVILNANTI